MKISLADYDYSSADVRRWQAELNDAAIDGLLTELHDKMVDDGLFTADEIEHLLALAEKKIRPIHEAIIARKIARGIH
jgi:hypothetical protein